ncbi:TPA: isoprenoid biosynthesis glyoxalase ElbB [Salmonella enterica]
MKKIGVVLSGCGVYDGAEIHEAVLTLLAIARSGAQAVCFAPDKPQADVINHLTGEAMAKAMHQSGKPLGFICIAPAMLPKIFDFPLRLTIGTDIDTAEVLEEMGAEHVPCPVDDIVVDEDNKVVTTPAYMLAQDIAQAASGIDKLVSRVLVLAE